MQNSFKKGILDGLPIALGYLSVSFAFGINATKDGLHFWASTLMSLTNLTSAGQFAGLAIITAGTAFVEMALTQLVINSRYFLMSVSLSQKLHSSVTPLQKLGIAFGITDEIFAVSMTQKGSIGAKYFYGLMLTPIIGWTSGTFLGAVAGEIFPASIISALSIAIYGMFLAIIIPPARKSRAVLFVVTIAALLSCLLTYIPLLSTIPSGFAIMICAIVAASVGALLFPKEDE